MVLLAVRTHHRSADWSDAERLWRSTLVVNPSNPSTMFMYGEALTHVGGHDMEVEFYYKEVRLSRRTSVTLL